MSLISVKFKGYGVVVTLGDDLYKEITSHKLFDKTKNQFMGNDKEMDYLCSSIPGFEDYIDGHICDFVKVYSEK